MAVSVEYGVADVDHQPGKSGRLTPLSALLSPRSHFRSAIPRSVSRASTDTARDTADHLPPSRSQSRTDMATTFDGRDAGTPSRGSGATSPLWRRFGKSSAAKCGARSCTYDDNYEEGLETVGQDGGNDDDARRQAYARARAAAARSENASFDSPTKRSNGFASLLSPTQARQAARSNSVPSACNDNALSLALDEASNQEDMDGISHMVTSTSMPLPKMEKSRSFSFDRGGTSTASSLEATPEHFMPPRPFSSLSHMPRPASPLSMAPRSASSLSQSSSGPNNNQPGSPFRTSISLVAKNRMDTIHSRPSTSESHRTGSNKSSPNSGGSTRGSPNERRRGSRSVSSSAAQQLPLPALAVPNDPYSQRVIRKRRNGGGTFIEGAGMYRGQGLANPLAGRKARPSSKASTPRSKNKGRLPIPPMPLASIEASKLHLQPNSRSATPTTSNSGSSISNALQTDLGAPAGNRSGTPSIRSRRASLTPSVSLPSTQQAPGPAEASTITHSLSSPDLATATPAKGIEITRASITPLEQYELIHRHLGQARSGSSQGHGSAEVSNANKASHAAADTPAQELLSSPSAGAYDVKRRPVSPPAVRPSNPFRRPSDASVTSPLATDANAQSVRRKPAPKPSSKQERENEERLRELMSQIEFDSERVTLKKTLGAEISQALKNIGDEESSAQYSPEVPTPPLSPPTPRMAQTQQGHRSDHSRRRSSQTSTNSTVPSDPNSASSFGAFTGPEIISMGTGAACMKLVDVSALGAKEPHIPFSPSFSLDQNAERRNPGRVPGGWLRHSSHPSDAGPASDLHDAANFFSVPGSPEASFTALPVPPRSSSRRQSRESTVSIDSEASFQSAEVFEELNSGHQASLDTHVQSALSQQGAFTQQLAVTSATSPSDLLALITGLGSDAPAGSAVFANAAGGVSASSQENWAVVLPVNTLRALLLESRRTAPAVSHPGVTQRPASNASVYSQASSANRFADDAQGDGAELESNIMSMLGVETSPHGDAAHQTVQQSPAPNQQTASPIVQYFGMTAQPSSKNATEEVRKGSESPTPSMATIIPRARSSTSPSAARNRSTPDSSLSSPKSPIPPVPHKSTKRYTISGSEFDEAAREQIPASPTPAHASRGLPSPSASPASQRLPLMSGMVGAVGDASPPSSPPSSPETFYAALSDDESFVVETGSKAPMNARIKSKQSFISSKHLKHRPHNYGYAQ